MSDLRIRVTRDRLLSDRTLGVVELDLPDDGAGWLPFGFSLEDTDRRLEAGGAKLRGQTAIPLGVYDVRLYDSPKHGPDTPELVAVQGYQHVQIHSGNVPSDTLGCILIGLSRDERQVLRSRVACDWLRAEVARVIRAGGRVTIEVRRATDELNDRAQVAALGGR